MKNDRTMLVFVASPGSHRTITVELFQCYLFPHKYKYCKVSNKTYTHDIRQRQQQHWTFILRVIQRILSARISLLARTTLYFIIHRGLLTLVISFFSTVNPLCSSLHSEAAVCCSLSLSLSLIHLGGVDLKFIVWNIHAIREKSRSRVLLGRTGCFSCCFLWIFNVSSRLLPCFGFCAADVVHSGSYDAHFLPPVVQGLALWTF